MSAGKKIVFINQDSGYLMIDIINEYANHGYNCVLITGRLVIRNKQLNENVRIKKIIRYKRNSIIFRLLTWLIATIQIFFIVKLKYRTAELFLVSNPPFATLLPLVIKNPFQILIFDIYPDVLFELGYISERSRIISWWKKANKKVYSRARRIFTITNSMKELLADYSGDTQIKVVPLWTDNKFLKPVDPSQNPFLIEHGLKDKFIVMYSGNIGLSSNLELLLDIAVKTTDNRILFLIIGDGPKKSALVDRVSEEKIHNVRFMGWQPVEQLPYSLSAASIAVIFHGKDVSKLIVPSKLYNFLSVGAPLLSITEEGSEVDNLVKRYNCGDSFRPSEINSVLAFIEDIVGNEKLHEKYSSNSLRASTDFTEINVKEFI